MIYPIPQLKIRPLPRFGQTQVRWLFAGWVWLLFGQRATGQPIIPEMRPPETARVVVVPPMLSIGSDPLVQRLLAQARAPQNASDAATRRSERFDRLLKPAEENLLAEDNLSQIQMQTLGTALFYDALRERLRNRLKVALVPEEEVQAALSAARTNAPSPLSPEEAHQLGMRLNSAIVLEACHLRVQTRSASTQEVIVWVELRVPLRSPEGGANVPPMPLPVAGAASAGRILFTDRYTDTKFALLRQAVRHAAARAVHTLRTGLIPLFSQAGERLALAPVLSRPTANKLRFTATGRLSIPVGVRDLPVEYPRPFQPTLLPLPASAIRRPDIVKLTMREQKIPLSALWESGDQPDIARVCQLGRKLRVDYILLARVLDIEVHEDVSCEPESAEKSLSVSALVLRPDDPQSYEGQAEVAGVLVRVADGAILWQDRASATMTLRNAPRRSPSAAPLDRLAALDAVKFALLELQRRFQRYDEGFLR
jgi:hypothetical protein